MLLDAKIFQFNKKERENFLINYFATSTAGSSFLGDLPEPPKFFVFTHSNQQIEI